MSEDEAARRVPRCTGSARVVRQPCSGLPAARPVSLGDRTRRAFCARWLALRPPRTGSAFTGDPVPILVTMLLWQNGARR